MSGSQIEESLALLSKEWDIDPLISDFVLGRTSDTRDIQHTVGRVTFHIPHLQGQYILWGCHWPDCHNCCERQGRLPLTSNDLITIGSTLKYSRVSDFIKAETITAVWSDENATISGINLKRRKDETEDDDGTRISCRFLDGEGSCRLHPARPAVCYLYPFTTWLVNSGGHATVHAAYQFTGDCPGFYTSPDMEQMSQVFLDYSHIIYDYNMKYTRTIREGLGAAAIGP